MRLRAAGAVVVAAVLALTACSGGAVPRGGSQTLPPPDSAVKIDGSAPTVILVAADQNLLGRWSGTKDRPGFADLVRGAGYRTVLFTHRHVDVNAPGAPSNAGLIAEWTAETQRVADAVHGRYVLAAADVNGYVALRIAAQRPKGLAGVILFSVHLDGGAGLTYTRDDILNVAVRVRVPALSIGSTHGFEDEDSASADEVGEIASAMHGRPDMMYFPTGPADDEELGDCSSGYGTTATETATCRQVYVGFLRQTLGAP